ncbi:MAG: MFS transporter [Pseudomonadota bacterium]
MSTIAKITLLMVVFVDLLGQGLVFPIINSLIMEPSSGFLPKDTPLAMRHFNYGLVVGMFFLSWFLGVVYIAKVSDAIGRKKAMLVCLFGALIGYILTILSLLVGSLWLLILGRSITGFTAGNQPIAQAAMIDGSTDEADRDRNVGYIITGISFGMVGGPIIGAFLSDRAVLGSFASMQLPFWGALVLVALTIVMVLLFYKDIRAEREPFVFRPFDVIDSLLKVRTQPLVLELLPVYTFFMIANVTFYVFIVNYLTSAFGYGVIGGSIAMMVIGVALATSSTFLVKPAQERFSKRSILRISLIAMFVCAIGFISMKSGALTYIWPFFFYLLFGIAYPTMLGLFSSSVEPEEQGWVMGVTTAVFCLAGGVMSLIGGWLMGIEIRLPYYIVIICAVLGLVLMFTTWRGKRIRVLVDNKPPSHKPPPGVVQR